MTKEWSSTVLVVFCGLPAAGKTSISKALINLAIKNNLGAFHIEFDQIERELRGGNFQQKEFDPEEWRRAREAAYSQIAFKLSEIPRPHLVIVDDNTPYRSMRKEYSRLAVEATSQGRNTICLLVFVDTSLDLALMRNRQRPSLLQVPEISIIKMSQKFDNPEEDGWTYFTKIENTCNVTSDLESWFTNTAQNILSLCMEAQKSSVCALPVAQSRVKQTLPRTVKELADLERRRIKGEEIRKQRAAAQTQPQTKE